MAENDKRARDVSQDDDEDDDEDEDIPGIFHRVTVE